MDRQKLMGLIAALVVLVLVLIAHLWRESRPRVPDTVTPESVPGSDRVAGDTRGDSDFAGRDTLQPVPVEASRPRLPPSNNLSAMVSLREHGFRPVNFDIRASSFPLNLTLSQSRPDSIHAEPRYKNKRPWFGVLRLGSPLRDYAFVLDLAPDKQFDMWFDANANGDLTDDPGPLKNQGSGDGGPGGFASVLRVPWSLLAPESGFSNEFEIWFFINKAGWEKGKRASHYSRTQLRGEATMNGQRYRAWVADSGYNDADLTNDGILVDLNGNGKADRDEWFADARADEKHAAGARGRVEVHW